MKIKRGHIYTANLDPRYGSEPGKLRPVVVLQTDYLNAHDHSSTLICALTSMVRKDLAPVRIYLKAGEAGLTKDSDIMIDQIRAIDNTRFKKELGKLSPTRLSEVEEKIKNVLDLD